MTDKDTLVERLREPLGSTYVAQGPAYLFKLCREAADRLQALEAEVNEQRTERLRALKQRDDAQAALQAAEGEVVRLREERAWRPIETAPKDGTRVLLWAPHWATALTGWTYGQDAWQDARHDAHVKPPSHWMPLPSPLREKQGDAG